MAHSLSLDGIRLKKGQRLDAEALAALEAAGVEAVTIARLGPEDMDENAAAWRLGQAMTPMAEQCFLRLAEPFTGRVNLFATSPGVFQVDRAVIDRFNKADPAITLATLPHLTRVAAGDMVATLKIIPYGVAEAAVLAAETAVVGYLPMLVSPPIRHEARLILTRTPGMAAKILAKGQAAVEARADALGLRLTGVEVVAHETGALAASLAQGAAQGAALGEAAPLTLILGASATSDAGDVCPAALVAAGGRLVRFGMPVDPGNLLVLGTLAGAPVLGLPGCARSPALNGADWVLERLVSGIEVGAMDIAGMGVGGLLKEIPTRPQPRAYPIRRGGGARVEIVVLAAGAGRRMAGVDKLLEPIDGEPLIRRAARVAVESGAARVHVVVPADNASEEARAGALAGLPVSIIRAPDAAKGMAHSLRAGVAALTPLADAALVALADMPDVTVADLDALIAAYRPEEGAEICRATTPDGTPGHPVLFGRRFFEMLSTPTGDAGARSVVEAGEAFLRHVPLAGAAAVTDLDTPEAWAAYRARSAEDAV